MDLGLGFDDDDFESKLKTTAGTKTSYNARLQNPLWFEDTPEDGTEDLNTKNHRLKFCADYHYHQGHFETAAATYRTLLECIPESNMPLTQDVEESLCRCYSKLNKHQESLEIAHRLLNHMRFENAARQRQSLLLLSQTCKAAGDWTGCISALEEMASLQCHYSPFWVELAHAYQQLTKSSGDTQQHMVEIVTCYVRAKLLIEAVQSTSVDIIKERNEAVIKQIDTKLTDLGASEHLMNKATEVLKEDIEHSSNSATDDDDESVSSDTHILKENGFSPDAFHKKWFSWATSLEVT